MSLGPDSTRAAALREGLAAGLGFALVDAFASGLHRTPFELLCVLFASGLLGGGVAGALGAAAGRRGVAAGLVGSAALALQGASLVSKELGHLPTELRLAGFSALALLAVWTGVLVAELVRSTVRFRTGWCALTWMSIPATSVLLWVLPDRTAYLVAVGALPLLLVGLAPFLAEVLAPRLQPALFGLAGLGLASSIPLLEGTRPEPATASSAARTPSDPGAPNVVVIVVDTLRADHTFVPETPNLERLAQEGVRFEQAISSAPWTLPSVASLLTGLWPSNHGAVDLRRRLPDDVETLAERFLEAGYETRAFTGGAFVSADYGMNQGFAAFADRAEYRFEPFRIHTPLAWRLVKNRYFPQRWILRFVHEFGGLAASVDQVERWLTTRDPERPYFLLVHTYEVHDYYIYHPEPDDRLRAKGARLPAPFADRLSVDPAELAGASQTALDGFEAIYRGRIAHVDEEIGRLIAELERRTDPERLIVAVTSDHGEGFDAETGRVHHGGRLHEDMLHVPLVLRAPGRLPAGRTVSELVRTIDLFPTVLSLADLDVPEVDGQNLLPALAGEVPFPSEAWAEEHLPGARWLALRRTDWKVIANGGENACYHLPTDPGERHPRPIPEPVRARWEVFREELTLRPGGTHELSADTLDQLRALGYL